MTKSNRSYNPNFALLDWLVTEDTVNCSLDLLQPLFSGLSRVTCWCKFVMLRDVGNSEIELTCTLLIMKKCQMMMPAFNVIRPTCLSSSMNLSTASATALDTYGNISRLECLFSACASSLHQVCQQIC